MTGLREKLACGALGILMTAALPVTAHASEFRWNVDTYNDETNKGRYTARLSYAIPETDAVQFAATCAAGSGGRFTNVVMGFDTGSRGEGKSVPLRIRSRIRTWLMRGFVFGTGNEEGVSGVQMSVPFDNRFWSVLAEAASLRYGIPGEPEVTLGLRGSGKAVRRFLSTCRTIHNASQGRAGNSGAAAAPTTAHETCKRYRNAKSQNSDRPVTVTFTNRSDGYRSIMWINFEGMPVEYGNLDPGQSKTIQTYITHPWMFTDGPGNCIEMFLPKAGLSSFEIKYPSPAFGPEND